MGNLKLVKNYMVGGQIVHRVTAIDDVIVYSNTPMDMITNGITLYFIINNRVLKTLCVEADAVENEGYLNKFLLE